MRAPARLTWLLFTSGKTDRDREPGSRVPTPVLNPLRETKSPRIPHTSTFSPPWSNAKADLPGANCYVLSPRTIINVRRTRSFIVESMFLHIKDLASKKQP